MDTAKAAHRIHDKGNPPALDHLGYLLNRNQQTGRGLAMYL